MPEEKFSPTQPPPFIGLDDGGTFAGGAELGLGQTTYLAEHCSKEFQLSATAIRVNAVNRVSDELAARGEHQLLFGTAQKNVHALRILDESKSAGPDERIVPDKACNYDISFASLEAITCVDEFPILSWTLKAK